MRSSASVAISLVAGSVMVCSAGCGSGNVSSSAPAHEGAASGAPAHGGAASVAQAGAAAGTHPLPDAGGGDSAGATSGTSIVCHPDPGFPSDAPSLSTTTWTDLTFEGFPFNDSEVATGVAFSPCNPSVLYLCTGSFDPAIGGLYRSTNAGTSWSRIGRVPPNFTGGDHLEGPNHVRVDPADPQHVYAVEGVRGGTQGFWVSTDGGDSFTMPEAFANLPKTANGIYPFDLYDIAVDPEDFSHILLSHHFGWGAKWEYDSGVLESSDGGMTWTVHEPQVGWGTGHAINFLFDPALGIGNRNTWLLGTQGNGMWRTTDAGKSWTQVTTNSIQHGGGTIYYDKTGVLYASGTPKNLRSTDNGEHWTEICATAGYTAVFGDGKQLYTRPLFSTGPFLVSPEGGDGTTWTEFSAQQFKDGPFEMTFDRTNGVLYSSTWSAGLWALKVE